MTAPAAEPFYLMTDAATLGAHYVAEPEVIAGRRAGSYRAVCGHVVLAASLTAQERTRCDSCAGALGRRRAGR